MNEPKKKEYDVYYRHIESCVVYECSIDAYDVTGAIEGVLEYLQTETNELPEEIDICHVEEVE